jgi:hypothetical protein
LAESGGGKLRCDWLGGIGRKGNELTSEARESAVGEIRGRLSKCTTPRRKRNPAIMPRHFGPTGSVKEAATYRGRAGQQRRAALVGPDPREIQMRI